MTAHNAARIDGTARVLLKEVASLVQGLSTEIMRSDLVQSEADKGLHALAVLEALAPKLNTLSHAHEMVAAALNRARPDADPILSIVTMEPATLEGAGIPGDMGHRPAEDRAQPLQHRGNMTVSLNGTFTAAALRGIAHALDVGHNPAHPGEQT